MLNTNVHVDAKVVIAINGDNNKVSVNRGGVGLSQVVVIVAISVTVLAVLFKRPDLFACCVQFLSGITSGC